jgi:hypothetical protein
VTNLAQYATRQVAQVSYVYVGWSDFENVEKRYIDGDYVRLGASNWVWGFGVPLRESAIAYARSIGADAVVYAEKTNWDSNMGIPQTEHLIGFYAHAHIAWGAASVSFTTQTASIQDQIVQAEDTLQRTWDRLPRAKKNALRAQEYAFINRNYSLRKTNPERWLALIKERTNWVAAQ